MNEWLQQVKDGWNETADSKWYQSLRTESAIQTIVNDPASAFHPEVIKLIKKCFSDLTDKKVLLPSSGDNHAAFAFALMGANVTSTDISERQLANAKEVSDRLSLHIDYICDDTMRLDRIQSNDFDLVYTSNGTHTWINDLDSMYRNISRVLKQGGYSIMYDIHPFQRPFVGEPWIDPKIKKSYFDATAYRHWRVADLCNAMIAAGLSVTELLELKAVNASFWFSYADLQKQTGVEKINDWNYNPMAALPAWISIATQKL